MLVNPQDNDAERRDIDPSVSVVQLTEGLLSDFSIQIVDGFESADPFPGVGVDDATIAGNVVLIEEDEIPLQVTGPAVTVFQDGKFLLEGIDYTFRYDATSNTIRLSPLTGLWPDGKVYVIRVNNRDRFVIDADRGADIQDGDVFTITNDAGATAVFEFDSGYDLLVEAVVSGPDAGESAVLDGEFFRISNGPTTVTFEFDGDGNTSAGNSIIKLTADETPAQLAAKIVAAVNAASAELGLTAVDVGNGRINLGGETNPDGSLKHTVDTVGAPHLTLSGQPGVQPSTTLQVPSVMALSVPASGARGSWTARSSASATGSLTRTVRVQPHYRFRTSRTPTATAFPTTADPLRGERRTRIRSPP